MFLTFFDSQFISISSSFNEDDDVKNQNNSISLIDYEKLIANHMLSVLKKNSTANYDLSIQPFYLIEIKNSLTIHQDIIQFRNLTINDCKYPNIKHMLVMMPTITASATSPSITSQNKSRSFMA